MFITMLYSGMNFGRNKTLDIYLTGLWGWKVSAIAGLSIQAVLLIFIPKMYAYLQKGNTDLGELTEPEPSEVLVEETEKKPSIELKTEKCYTYEDEIKEGD